VSDERGTEQLVARLAGGVAPVRPIAALHRQALLVGAAFAATAALTTAWLGLHPMDVLERGALSMSFAWELALIGGGGLLLGLASRIPGYERITWIAAGLAAVGLLGVLGDIAALGGAAFATPFSQCDGCYVKALILAVPASIAAGLLARRGAPWRTGVAGVAVALGAAAAGGLLVHLYCPSPDPSHWLQGHALAPLGTGAVLGLAVAYTGLIPRFFAGRGSSGRDR
jgi:hypothetical protein